MSIAPLIADAQRTVTVRVSGRQRLTDRATRWRVLLGWSVALVLLGCSNGSVSLAEPQGLEAVASPGTVELGWRGVPGATAYEVRARARIAGAQWNVVQTRDTRRVHTGLQDGVEYEYLVRAVAGALSYGPYSSVVGVPGPQPGPIISAAVLRQGDDELIEWAAVHDATHFRVYWSVRKFSLPFADSDVHHADVAALRFVNPAVAALRAYYRVVAFNGPRPGTASPLALAPQFRARVSLVDPNVTPALDDIDGDGCLDLPVALGDCAGGFIAFEPATRGLGALFGPGRVNRDSRFADFDGDGQVDIFSNVYSDAGIAESAALLHLNRGGGVFREVPGVTAMGIRGYGETVVAADFNNDGLVDLFVPHYWHRRDGGRNWLLINDGRGGFVDATAGSGLTGFANDPAYVPEGAQAIDLDLDGRLDIVVQSTLFINNGDLTFSRSEQQYGLPHAFDEGIKFADFDLDGDFDYFHNDGRAVRLYRNVGGRLDAGTVLTEAGGRFGHGLSLCDVNSDGREDLAVARIDDVTRAGYPQLFLNTPHGFISVDSLEFGSALFVNLAPDADYTSSNDLLSCADLDRDGNADLLVRTASRKGFTVYSNHAGGSARIVVRALGAAGQRNQQGRVVRVKPLALADVTLARAVESGSGYLSQGDYDLNFATPWDSQYLIEVRFATGWVRTQAAPGTLVIIRETGEVASSTL